MPVYNKVKLLFLTLLLVFPVLTSAEIFSWKDENGKLHFGDRPPVDRESEQVRVRVNTYRASAEVSQVEFLTTSKDKVVLYTTQRCGYCKQARQFLRRNKISYQEYDVETSSKGRRDYKKLNGRGVPIILVGDQRMNGFSEGHMTTLLKQAGYDI